MFGTKKSKKVKKKWGYIEEIAKDGEWRIDKITIYPGQRDKLHAQPSCRHSCYVLQGNGRVYAGPARDVIANYIVKKDTEFVINNDWLHCYQNIGKGNLVIIQNSYGKFDLEELTSKL